MRNTQDQGMTLNQIEYGYLVEDTPSNARVMKVSCPKLTPLLGDSPTPYQQGVNKDDLDNDDRVPVDAAPIISCQDYLTARVCMEFAHRHKFHDCWPIGQNCVNMIHKAKTSCPGISELVECHHYHHDHHFHHRPDGMIPKGTKMMLLFMDNNPNDCYVTRMWCEHPGGKAYGNPPAERLDGD